MSVDNVNIKLSGVNVWTGNNPPTVEDLDIDFSFSEDANKNKFWTLSLNPTGTSTGLRVHHKFTQADMGQILSVLNGLWNEDAP